MSVSFLAIRKLQAPEKRRSLFAWSGVIDLFNIVHSSLVLQVGHGIEQFDLISADKITKSTVQNSKQQETKSMKSSHNNNSSKAEINSN